MNKNPKIVATYIDAAGVLRKIHKNRGNRLAVARKRSTPVIELSKTAGELIGARIREARKRRGMTAQELGERAGFVDSDVKNRVLAIEKSTREGGPKMGTLYAIAIALECEVSELMPRAKDVLKASCVDFRAKPTLQMPKDDPYRLQEA